MAHNKCLKYSLFWAATATAPISTCTLDATITSVDDEDITTPVVTPCTEGYGLLYNWYAATDARKISSSDDWIVPNDSQINALITATGGSSQLSVKLSDNTFGWSTGITRTNQYLFNARGAGSRTTYSPYNGNFISLGARFWMYSSDFISNSTSALWLTYDNTFGYLLGNYPAYYKKTDGFSIRLLYTGVGTPTSYTGNNGKIYRVAHVGTQYWLADNLQENKFRNGDIIPYHGIDNENNFTNTEWIALTTAGVCAFANDVANVGCDFSFEPTVIVVPEPEENCDIFVPQGFSPSNQDGINDYFRVQNLECYPIHKMSIYDRNGSLLYTRTNNYDTEPWDGKVGGTIVSGVTRTWILEINGAIHSTGSVYVI